MCCSAVMMGENLKVLMLVNGQHRRLNTFKLGRRTPEQEQLIMEENGGLPEICFYYTGR